MDMTTIMLIAVVVVVGLILLGVFDSRRKR